MDRSDPECNMLKGDLPTYNCIVVYSSFIQCNSTFLSNINFSFVKKRATSVVRMTTARNMVTSGHLQMQRSTWTGECVYCRYIMSQKKKASPTLGILPTFYSCYRHMTNQQHTLQILFKQHILHTMHSHSVQVLFRGGRPGDEDGV